MTRAQRIAAIVDAWQAGRREGAPVDMDALCAEHPDLADELRQRLQALDLVERAYAEGSLFTGPTPQGLGAYEIHREVGRGGMGVVYEAVETSTRRDVALKVLFPSMTGSPHAIERFEQEARAAGRIQHANIVPVHATGHEAGTWFCVMELVAGTSLATLLHRMRNRCDDPHRAGGPAPTDPAEMRADLGTHHELARRFAGVADALQAAHDEGITHRAVKPANLILDDEGLLRIADFGVACIADEVAHATRTGELLGTLVYQSPEQVSGQADGAGSRTDIYSLGATLYEALTLRPPFRGTSGAGVARQILSTEPPRPRQLDRGIPKELETIVLKAMEKDPERRYGTVGDMARDLRAFADDRAIDARRAGPFERFAGRVKQHRALAVVNALLLAGLLTAFLLGRESSEEVERRRAAEYELLVRRATDALPSDHAAGYTHGGAAAMLLDHAIAVQPDRAEAYVARALAVGRTPEQRLADATAAAERGLDAATTARLRAVLLHGSGRTAEAVETEAGVSPDAGSTSPLDELLLGMRATQRGELSDARLHLSAVIDAAPPGSLVTYLALRERAAVLGRLGREEKALADLYATRDRGDRGPGTTLRIAALARRLGRDDEAEALVTAALEQDFLHPSQWVVFLESCQRAGEHAWAERAGRRAIEIWPTDGRLRALHGRTLALLGRPEEALEHLEEAARLSPKVGMVHALLALTQSDLRRVREALASAERAVELAPNDLWVRRIQVSVLHAAGRLDDAFTATESILALSPEDPEMHRLQGRIRADQGRFDEAEAALERAAALAPHAPDLLLNLAVLRVQRGNIDGARETAGRILEAAPDHAPTHHLLGQLLSRSGEHDHAVASLRRAVELDATLEPYRHDLARALLTAERYAEAREVLDAAVQDFPDHPRPATTLALLLTTAPDRSQWDAESALTLARRATSDGRGGPLPRIALALALHRSGRHLEALEALDAFDGTANIDPAAYLVVALARSALGDSELARARLAATEGRLDPADPRPEAAMARRLRAEAERVLAPHPGGG